MPFFSVFIPMYGSAVPNFVWISCSRDSMETGLSWCTSLHFVWVLVKGSHHILPPVKSSSCQSSPFSSPYMVVQIPILFGFSCSRDCMETVLFWCTCLHFVWFLVKVSYHISPPVKSPSCHSSTFPSPCMVVQFPTLFNFSCSGGPKATVLSWCTWLIFVWVLVKVSYHISPPVKSSLCHSSPLLSPCMVVQFPILFGYSCSRDCMETVSSWCTCLHFVWFLVKVSYHI
jgi:hypothetical protein